MRSLLDFSENVVGEGETITYISPEQAKQMIQWLIVILADADALWKFKETAKNTRSLLIVSDALDDLPEHLK